NILNCIITSNRGARVGGALISGGQYGGNLGIVSNCVISYNTATMAGSPGGLELQQKAIFNSEISSNTGPIGGLLSGWYSDTIDNCKIIGNQGIVCGGASLTKGYTWRMKNCLIYGNHATTGPGGMMINDDYSRSKDIGYLRNCVIVSNSTASLTNTGGIYFGSSTNLYYLYNSIVSRNTSGSANSNVCNTGKTNIFIQNCCIGMTNGALWPSTNINNVIYADPLLLDLPAGNCRLDSKSPCINAGYYESWMATGVDLDDRIRIRYGTVDLGAFEFIRSGAVYGFH
ncbi:MAG: hypothetical protein ABIH24_03765, partial [Verrucomicrobiota bacterium]